MNPEALLRNRLQAFITYSAALVKAEREYSAALEQMLDKGFKAPVEVEVQP